MEESQNTVLSGVSAEARRNLHVESAPNNAAATTTPRDKENAGANSTHHRHQAEASDQSSSKATSSSGGGTVTTTAQVPPTRTPARSRLTGQTPRQKISPSFFSVATTPSPNAMALPATNAKDATSSKRQQQHHHHHQSNSPAATTPAPSFPSSSLSSAKSPPGTSQVLRKHFQSLGFSTPPGKHAIYHHQHQQRMLSSGAVRLTPANRINNNNIGNQQHPNNRIGFDGTKHTPSKELLKSTASSRNQRVLGLQDMSMSMDQHQNEEQEDPTREDNEDDGEWPATMDEQPQQQLLPYQMQPVPEASMMMDDDTVASSATVDDASFDMSLPSMSMNNPNNSFFSNASNILPAPHSPLTPRMGCLNPVALTLLNDGKEDYNYLITQDALYPIPKVEDHTTMDVVVSKNTTTSAASPSCLSPTFGAQSPAEVRATLSHKVRSTLARPVAILPKTGRISPSQAHTPRLRMRPQPKHVR